MIVIEAGARLEIDNQTGAAVDVRPEPGTARSHRGPGANDDAVRQAGLHPDRPRDGAPHGAREALEGGRPGAGQAGFDCFAERHGLRRRLGYPRIREGLCSA